MLALHLAGRVAYGLGGGALLRSRRLVTGASRPRTVRGFLTFLEEDIASSQRAGRDALEHHAQQHGERDGGDGRTTAGVSPSS
jgi:hypothetical protein